MHQDRDPNSAAGDQTLLLTRLLRASEALSQSLHLPDVLQTLTDAAADLLDRRHVAIYLREGDELIVGASSPPRDADFPAHLLRAPLRNHPHIQLAITTAEPVLVPDLREAALSSSERQITELLDLRSALYLPVMDGSQVLGVLIASTGGEVRPIRAADVATGRTLCGLAAVAITNARLYRAAQDELAERTRRAAEQREELALMQIVAEISSALTTVTTAAALDQVVNDTLRRLGELFQADRVFLSRLVDAQYTLVNTHQWFPPGVVPHPAIVPIWAMDRLPWWKARTLEGAVSHFPDIGALPPEAAVEQALLSRRGVRSVLTLPTVSSAGTLAGILGMEMTQRAYTWGDGQIAMLGSIAATIGNTLERLQVEAARRELQDRLALLADHLPGVIYQLRRRPDGSQHVPFAGAGTMDLFGVTPADVQEDATPLFRYIHPDDLAGLLSSLDESAAHMRSRHSIYRVQHPAGHIVWVEARATPQQLEDASIVWHGYAEDISARKAAEAEQQFRIAFLQGTVAISTELATVTTCVEFDGVVQEALARLGALFDADRTYLFRFSADYARMTNTHEWCAPGVTSQIAVIQDVSVDQFAWTAAQMRDHGVLHISDVAMLPPEAAAEHAEFSRQGIRALVTTPTFDSRRQMVGFLGMDMVRRTYTWSDEQIAMLGILADAIGNTLERLRAEAARHEAQERLSFLSDQLPGFLYQFRVRPDGTSHFPYASAGISAYFGFGPERVYDDATPAFDAVHPDDRARFDASIAASAAHLTPWREVYRMLRPTGEVIWVEGRATPQRQDDGSIIWHGYTEDITERQRLQTRLVQAQKMETVGQLAGGIAHDFNNMLAVIMLRAETSLRLSEPESKLHQNLSSILHTAQRSAELVRQLLGFARKQVIAPQVLDLNATVAAQIAMLQRLIGEEIELMWRPAAVLWPLWMDPSQVDQILINLCVNARDAIAGHGMVEVSTDMLYLDDAQAAALVVAGARPVVAGDYVTLTVRDNGSGMDAATLAQIFEPFFTTKGVGQGTGLGLANVYGIVQQNRGYICVESRVGVGTTFVLYLPRVQTDGATVDAAPGNMTVLPAARDKTILLVEDEEPVLEMAVEALEMLGYRVLATPSPQAALDLAEQYSDAIDLLLTDIVMPEMNGRELAQRLAARRPALRVLYTSGYPRGDVVARGVLESGVHFLQKPYSISQLALKVLEAFEDGA